MVWLLLIAAGTAVSQVPYFQHYSLLKKNEPVQVNAIHQDKTGYMWFGTTKGLFKFDGNIFARFTVADSLPDNHVTALASDSTGRLWMGFRNGAMAVLENGKISKFTTAEGDAVQEVSDILFDKRGILWFSTLNDGLYYFRNNRLYRLDEDDGLPDLFVYDIIEDKNGNIWAGTDGGVAVCSIDNANVSITTFNYAKGLPDNIIKKFALDDNNVMWMATEDAGIIRFDSVGSSFKPMLPDWNLGGISDFTVTGNQIWIASPQSGLLVFDQSAKKIKRYDTKADADLGSIQTIIADREENIWTGSRTELMRTQGDHLEFIPLTNLVNDSDVISLALDAKGNEWFSTKEGLFKRSIDSNGNVRLDRPLLKTPYQKYTVISLFADKYGYLWAGLYGEGVLRINIANGSVRYLLKELRNGNILSITGKNDVVWLATLGGVSQINIKGEDLTIKNIASEDGLVSDYIYQIFIDSNDRVWFATDGKGVDMLDGSGFHHYQEGLNSKVVYGFAEDGMKRLWVNVQGDGLYRFENDRFIQFDPDGKKLRDNNIACFTATPSGNIFIMHDLGIDIYNITRDVVDFHGEESGIHNMTPNLNALAKNQFGEIFVGTDNGIIKYSDFAFEHTITPTPVIEGLNIVNQPVPLSGDMTFSYDKNDVTIFYRGLWFQNPGALSYQYRLKNYDKDWIATRNQSVTYSSLPPGEYVFELKISDMDDFSGAQQSSITFVVLPPFWKTTWFYVVVAVLVIFIIFSIITFRERKLIRDKHNLEVSVRERTLEIVKKNDEIHEQAEEIKAINENLEQLVKERTSELERKNKALEEYAFINAHELRAPVASILGLINLMSTIELDEEQKVYLEHLQSSAEKLDTVVRSIGKAIEKGGVD